CTALGEEIIKQGHTLLNGCLTPMDHLIAEAAWNYLERSKTSDPEKRIISYLLINRKPIHNFGTIIHSRLSHWEIDTETFLVPEQIKRADVVIMVAGFEGTFSAANWARIAEKPVLPVTAFGGAAAKIYQGEFDQFDEKYAPRIEKLDYEELNSAKNDWPKRAER